MSKLAVIKVRGTIGVKKKIVDTMIMLRLYKKNHCVILEKNPIILGMLRKIKDYITYGQLDEVTYRLLIDKKGEEYIGNEKDSKGKIKYNKFIVINNKKYKKYFRLNPPRKGFGRKGIKKSFSLGGALGYRGEKINDLIKRMI